MPQANITAKEMLSYRDQVTQNLERQIEILDELNAQNIFGEANDIFTKHNYPEKRATIQGEIEKLKNFDVVLAVVGTMKAGKSTTINAIVGHEILPNRNRPMTALPTLIYHTPGQTEPEISFRNPDVNRFISGLGKLLQQHPAWKTDSALAAKEMQELMEKISQGWNLKETYHGEDEIFEFLADLNDLVRLSEILRQTHTESAESLSFPFASCRNIDQLPKIKVAFRHLDDLKDNEGRIILLDTPGPNEAGQAHLKTMLAEQLRRSSAVLLVLDYTQLKSEASDDVKQQLAAIPSLSQDRLFALVNKFDQKTSNSDGEEATKELIFSDFLKDRIEKAHIFPVASQQAFLANRMKQELETKGKPDWQEQDENWISDFIHLAYGSLDSDEWQEESRDDIQNKIERLLKRSKIQAPMEEAIAKTQMEAPRIAMRSALATLSVEFDDIKNFCAIQLTDIEAKTDEEIAALEAMIERAQNNVNELLASQKTVEEMLKEMCEEQGKFVLNTIEEVKNQVVNSMESFKDEEINSLEELLKNQEEKLNDYKSMSPDLWGKKRKKIDEKLAGTRELLKLIRDGNRVFDSEEKVKNVLGRFDELYRLQVNFINHKTNEIQNKYLDKITAEVAVVEQMVQKTFGDIERDFHQENIEIHLAPVEIGQFIPVECKETLSNSFVTNETRTVKYAKSGFFNKIWRWLGTGGVGEREITVYRLDIEKLQTNIQSELKNHIEGIKQQMEDSIHQFSSQWVTDYIGTVSSRAQALIDSLKNRMNLDTNEKIDKENFQTILKKLKKQNEDVLEDIQKILNLFGMSVGNIGTKM